MFNFFKKKEQDPRPKTLAAVIDKNLSTYVKVANINNSVKTALILFGLTALFANLLMDSFEVQPTDHIATIAFSGVVSSQNRLANARAFSESFVKAIEDDSAKAIMIIAQSGGGSPVQGEMIHDLIEEYTNQPIEERKPVYVSVQEVCASACVMAMVPADKIYVHKNSLIGSISVRMDGWAIDKALAKFDIERKVLSPGKYKDLFDPYKTLSASEKKIIFETLLNPMHKSFVDTVKHSRGDVLDTSNEMLFTGMAWSGSDGVKLGLADGVKTTLQLEHELKTEFSVEEIKRYNTQGFSLKSLLETSMENAITSVINSQMEMKVTS